MIDPHCEFLSAGGEPPPAHALVRIVEWALGALGGVILFLMIIMTAFIFTGRRGALRDIGQSDDRRRGLFLAWRL